MRLTSLGSGSSGNAFVLETESSTLLLDCGVPTRKLKRSIQDMGLTGRINGIVISHEHSDHVRSLKGLLKSCPTQVFATSGTFDAIGREPGWQQVKAGSRISIAGVAVTMIGVSHDAADPCGFYVECEDISVALFTDLGEHTADVADAAGDAHLVVLEANYDPATLRRSAYPEHVKHRIRSPRGHLSNDDAAALLAESVSARTQGIWLAHLSKNNNREECAISTVEQALEKAGHPIPVHALPRYRKLELEFPSREASFRQQRLL